jgi:hypothetical protein
MTKLTDRQQRVLDRGLDALDAAHRRRRRARTSLRAAVALASLVAGATATYRLARPARPALPAYVEIITDDPQLASELALANACERFERDRGRLVVVECLVPAGGERPW